MSRSIIAAPMPSRERKFPDDTRLTNEPAATMPNARNATATITAKTALMPEKSIEYIA